MNNNSQNFHVDWIGVDWGTTFLRAWAISREGQVLAKLSSQDGMAKLAPGEYEAALISLVGGWLNPNKTISIIACGMVGSRQGWIEAPYLGVPCLPLAPQQLVKPQTTDPRIDVYVVPGIKQQNPPDVMRGEETQIAGFLAMEPDFEGTICLPGTHTKWVRIVQGEIKGFGTFLTGELFSLLSKQSVLRHCVAEAGWDEAVFLKGVSGAFSNPELFAADLFAIRAETLIGDLSSQAARSKLSGLLIGLELHGAQKYWLGQPVVIIGESQLSNIYAQALKSKNSAARIINSQDITLEGLNRARQITQPLEMSQ